MERKEIFSFFHVAITILNKTYLPHNVGTWELPKTLKLFQIFCFIILQVDLNYYKMGPLTHAGGK